MTGIIRNSQSAVSLPSVPQNSIKLSDSKFHLIHPGASGTCRLDGCCQSSMKAPAERHVNWAVCSSSQSVARYATQFNSGLSSKSPLTRFEQNMSSEARLVHMVNKIANQTHNTANASMSSLKFEPARLRAAAMGALKNESYVFKSLGNALKDDVIHDLHTAQYSHAEIATILKETGFASPSMKNSLLEGQIKKTLNLPRSHASQVQIDAKGPKPLQDQQRRIELLCGKENPNVDEIFNALTKVANKMEQHDPNWFMDRCKDPFCNLHPDLDVDEMGNSKVRDEFINLAQDKLDFISMKQQPLHYVGFASGNMKNDFDILAPHVKDFKSIKISIVDPKYKDYTDSIDGAKKYTGADGQSRAPGPYESLMDEVEMASSKATLESFSRALTEKMDPHQKLTIQVFPDAHTFMNSRMDEGVNMIVGADYFLPGESGALKTYDEKAHADFNSLIARHPDAHYAELGKTKEGFEIQDQ